MPRIQRSALVPRRPELVFDLVNDVDAYPRHFAWCAAAGVRERTADAMLAELTLTWAGAKLTLATRNRFVRPSKIALELAAGPLQSLQGAWSFTAIGDAGCRVSLDLDFRSAGTLASIAFARGFGLIADRLVHDFTTVAMAQAESAHD